MTNSIFISYRREDSVAHTGRLYDVLSREFPKDTIFMDMNAVEPGDDFAKIIREKVGACSVFIAIIGKEWSTVTNSAGNRRLNNADDFVRLEIADALRLDIRVIPVLVGGARLPDKEELPEDLRALVQRNVLEISDERFHFDANRLVKTIEKTLLLSQEKNKETKHRKKLSAVGYADEKPVEYKRQPIHKRSRVRKLLLLYKPQQAQSCKYHITFYLFIFILVPFFSLLAAGAYFGPDATLGGIPAVLFFLALGLFARHRAVRDDVGS